MGPYLDGFSNVGLAFPCFVFVHLRDTAAIKRIGVFRNRFQRRVKIRNGLVVIRLAQLKQSSILEESAVIRILLVPNAQRLIAISETSREILVLEGAGSATRSQRHNPLRVVRVILD